MEKLEIKIDRHLFSYIGLTLMLFYYQLSDTILYISSMEYCLVLSLLMFMIQFFLDNQHYLKQVGIIIVMLGIFAIQYKYGHDSRILVFIIALLGLKEMPLKKVMKTILYEKSMLICCIILITATGTGFIPKTSEYTLGFIHGNLFMISILETFLLYICLNWRKMNQFSNIVVTICIFLTFIASSSKTGLLLFTLSFILYLQIKYSKIKRLNYLNKITIIAPVSLFLVSIFIPYLINQNVFRQSKVLNSIVYSLDSLLSKRLTLASTRLANTSIYMLHSTTDEIEMRLYKYTVVDSGYVQLILVYGLLGSIMFLLFYTKMIQKISQMEWLGKEKYIYLLSILIMSLYAFTENSLCSLKYNFTLLFVLMLLQKEISYPDQVLRKIFRIRWL